MINPNLFLGVAGQGSDQGYPEFPYPYPPSSLWNGHLVVERALQTPSIRTLHHPRAETARGHHWLATVPSPVTMLGLNYSPFIIPGVGSARVHDPRDYGFLQLVVRAIDAQCDSKALVSDIYRWLSSYDPVRFPVHDCERWKNRVRCCLTKNRKLFMKTAEKGSGYRFGRLARGHYWCRRPTEIAPEAAGAKEGKPARVARLLPESAVTPAIRATATTSTISDAGRASTTGQIK